jgi:hypothetical protein
MSAWFCFPTVAGRHAAFLSIKEGREMRLRSRGERAEGTQPREHATGAPAYDAEPGAPEPESGPREPESGPRERQATREAPAAAPRHRSLAWRSRDAGAAAVGTAGAGVLLLARVVMAAASLIALLIALAIVLRDVDANATNTIVKGVHEGANFFAGAFTGLIRFSGHPKRAITVDWGIALIVYLIVGAIASRLIANLGRGGVLFEHRHRPAAGNY